MPVIASSVTVTCTVCDCPFADTVSVDTPAVSSPVSSYSEGASVPLFPSLYVTLTVR